MLTSLAIGKGGLGRFGNNCFTIAGVIGIAIKSGQPFGFPAWKTYDNANFGQPVDEMTEYFVNPLPTIVEDVHYEQYPYFWEYRDIHLPIGNWDMFAHLQSVKYFEHCIDTIRHYFRMKDESGPVDRIALHYRAGDYIEGAENYHPRCSKEYYEAAINNFPPGSNFTIFTDDIAAFSKLNVDFSGHSTHNSFGKFYLDDFKFMKQHKHFICANSSFSHFAALLGEHPEKKIIMPKRWFGAAAGGMNFDSLYPPNAIII